MRGVSMREEPPRDAGVRLELQGLREIQRPPPETPDLSFNPYKPDSASLQDAMDRLRKGYVVYQGQVELIVQAWERMVTNYRAQVVKLEERDKALKRKATRLEKRKRAWERDKARLLKMAGVTAKAWEAAHPDGDEEE